MQYRKDIDGLRTLAVLLVIFDHVGFSRFAGGFVGVDVFFVISGFLITGIVHRAIAQGTFSMGSFLARRMKRLLPALLLMVAVTTVTFSWVMLPSDLRDLYRSVIWVVLYVGNFFFWRVYGLYFGANAEEAPLLHTWSLAVEEQFYLIWPITLLFIARLCSERARIYVVGVLFLVATQVSQLGTEMTFGAAYYLLPTRFFELLLGSWLALAWERLPRPQALPAHALSAAGLGAIVFSAVTFDAGTSFPGYNALLPTLGTALLIYARDGAVNRMLSLRPFVLTGLLSYSMYLWHWPIVTWLRYTAVDLVLAVQLAVIATTYGISWLSWKYVERPLRYSSVQGFKATSVRFFLVPGGLTIALAVLGLWLGGFKGFSPEVLAMERALRSRPEAYRTGCHASLRESEIPPAEDCAFGEATASETSLLVLGDSHANHFVPFVEVLAQRANRRGQDYTMDTCLPVLDLLWGDDAYREQRCQQRNQLAFDYVDSRGFDYVVLAGDWPRLPTDDSDQSAARRKLFEERMRATLARIVASGSVPVVIESAPYLGETQPKCPIRKKLYDANLHCAVENRPNDYFATLMEELAVSFPELQVLSPRELFCGEQSCETELEGIPLFRDAGHLNLEGSRVLAKHYLQVADNPFERIAR